jgi:hypothetical protein
MMTSSRVLFPRCFSVTSRHVRQSSNRWRKRKIRTSREANACLDVHGKWRERGKHGCWSWLNLERPNLNSGRGTRASMVRGQHIRCVTPLHHGGGDAAGITSVDPCAIDALAKNRLPIHFHEADSPGRSSRSPMPGWRYTPVSRFGNTSFSAKPSQLLGSGGRH